MKRFATENTVPKGHQRMPPASFGRKRREQREHEMKRLAQEEHD
jgi:hypothetical protein